MDEIYLNFRRGRGRYSFDILNVLLLMIIATTCPNKAIVDSRLRLFAGERLSIENLAKIARVVPDISQ